MFEVNESVSDTRDIKEEEEEEVRTASSHEERGDAKHRQHQKCRSEAQTRIRRVFFSRSVRFEGERLSSVSERCPNRVIIHRSCWHFGNHRFHGKGRSGGSPPKTSFKSVVEKKAATLLLHSKTLSPLWRLWRHSYSYTRDFTKTFDREDESHATRPMNTTRGV